MDCLFPEENKDDSGTISERRPLRTSGEKASPLCEEQMQREKAHLLKVQTTRENIFIDLVESGSIYYLFEREFQLDLEKYEKRVNIAVEELREAKKRMQQSAGELQLQQQRKDDLKEAVEQLKHLSRLLAQGQAMHDARLRAGVKLMQEVLFETLQPEFQLKYAPLAAALASAETDLQAEWSQVAKISQPTASDVQGLRSAWQALNTAYQKAERGLWDLLDQQWAAAQAATQAASLHGQQWQGVAKAELAAFKLLLHKSDMAFNAGVRDQVEAGPQSPENKISEDWIKTQAEAREAAAAQFNRARAEAVDRSTAFARVDAARAAVAKKQHVILSNCKFSQFLVQRSHVEMQPLPQQFEQNKVLILNCYVNLPTGSRRGGEEKGSGDRRGCR